MVGAVALAVTARLPALSVEMLNTLSDKPVSVVGVSVLG